MSRVLVIGNATIDVVQRVARLPSAGETLLGAPPARCAGGKGLNQAIAAARAGAAVTFVAPIGDDAEGQTLRTTLAGEGLAAVEWIVTAWPTDVSAIWVDAAGRNMIVSSAACAHALEPAMAVAAIERLAAGDWLLLQGNLSAATSLAAARAARERGVRVVVNAAPIAFDCTALIAQCDVLIVNEVEAATLAGIDDAREAGRRLARGPSVILTLGADGALLIADGETVVPAPRVAVVDTAGAGDVLVGTLVALASQDVPVADALSLAVAAASLAVTRPGTSPSFPTRAELAALRSASRV